MLYKDGKRVRDFVTHFLFLVYPKFLYFVGLFNKTILPLTLDGHEVITANSE